MNRTTDPKLSFSRACLRPVLTGWLILLVLGSAPNLLSQTGSAGNPTFQSGEQIYKSGCVACHGADGKGAPESSTVFARPSTFPDFSRCDQTTSEVDSAYKDVILHGGPARGFSQVMPSFDQMLTPAQVDEAIRYLRDFCRQSGWPRGELNVPRAMVTEKAYPEDEEVVSTAVNANRTPGVQSHIIHEQRFGKNNQIEVDVPITFQNEDHVWYGGVGDTTLGIKRVMFSNLRAGSIFSLQGSVIFPSGNRQHDLGSGTTTFETFAAFDQVFPTNTILQTQVGADLPRHTNIESQSVFFHSAIGQIFAADHGTGRMWTPMMEFLAERDLEDRARTDWDVLPQLQVTISRRQHIRGDFGVRVPVTNTSGRSIQLMLYLLWDWQDGSLTKGW